MDDDGQPRLNSDVWTTVLNPSTRRFQAGICKICSPTSRFTTLGSCSRHEKSQKHQDALETCQSRAASKASNVPNPAPPNTSNDTLSDLFEMVKSFQASRSQQSQPLPTQATPTAIDWLVYQEGFDTTPFDSEPSGLDADEWGRFAAAGEGTILDADLGLEQTSETVARLIEDALKGDAIDELDSDLEDAPISEPDELFFGTNMQAADDQTGENVHGEDLEDLHGRKRQRLNTQDMPVPEDAWYPWPDKISFMYDLMTHLPRFQFSVAQQELLDAFLTFLGIDDVPSQSQKQKMNDILQKYCGINTLRYEGALGHIYYLNSISELIAQDFANPEVRPHMRFYPEDTQGTVLAEAYQADCWLHEAPDDSLTPMVRLNTGDFFIHEPALLRDASMVMPTRWFTRDGGLHAKCWPMSPSTSNGHQGWRVMTGSSIEVSVTDFLLNFIDLKNNYVCDYGGPDPTIILDMFDETSGTSTPWSYTNPVQGNKWREAAKGHRVVSMPLWLYCDDTSGNVSKKWNKHNSFLFTPANLPREQSQKEYNVNFVGTSNIAPPLEMLDGVVDQLEKIREVGIWAWDCENKEYILVLLWILAFLGDNPMQSEFACHIGLRGRLFCRVCKVEGKRRSGQAKPTAGQSAGESDDDGGAGSDGGDASDAASEASVASNTRKRRQPQESLSGMVQRITNFIKIGQPRTREDTMQKLKSMFLEARTVGSATNIQSQRTAYGIKDNYQMHFLDRLANSYKNKRTVKTKQEALDAELSKLPSNTSSPVWRIKGLDPHKDTPVEVLHVILLGFLRYMWRDLIQNQLAKSAVKKEELIARLEALDVRALGISRLNGQTLVQYAGSLTGRDFRIIAQVAPFVIPLVWQPVIYNVHDYLGNIAREIQHFLLCTAQWTCRWFNKPKFHIMVHLPEHIRRFGPAMLFATEAFESFNAVIRIRSVHSNRHAPSRDIAKSFAQANRMRHLASGGYFRRHPTERNGDWVTVGYGVRNLLARDTPFSRHIGLDRKKVGENGTVVQYQAGTRCFLETKTGFHCSDTAQFSEVAKQAGVFRAAERMLLLNGDECRPGFHVIWQRTDSTNNITLHIACVEEILSNIRADDGVLNRPGSILVRSAEIQSHTPTKYNMPQIVFTQDYTTITLPAILCAVNLQHNCAAFKCSLTGVRHVRQEREITGNTKATIVHQQPEALILNLAQMRSAAILTQFRLCAPDLETREAQILRGSAERELRLQRAIGSSKTSAGPASSGNNSVPARPSKTSAAPASSGSTSVPARPQRVAALQVQSGPSSGTQTFTFQHYHGP